MIDREQMEDWYDEYGEEEECPVCGMVLPVVFMCEDTTYCEHFLAGNEDFNEEGEE
jgi:hypothetical protein